MTNAFVIRSSDIARCPIGSMSPLHYRPDGSCRCDGDPGVCVHCNMPTVLVGIGKTSERRVHTATHERRCWPNTRAEVRTT